jgi:hypothetical protein
MLPTFARKSALVAGASRAKAGEYADRGAGVKCFRSVSKWF